MAFKIGQWCRHTVRARKPAFGDHRRSSCRFGTNGGGIAVRVRVCGLELPSEIVLLASDESWTAYTEEHRLSPAVVEAVFGEAPDPTWKFYSLDEMQIVTEEWQKEIDPQWFGSPPDDIDAGQSILIGELGYDRPFALDFRSERPTVRFMTIAGRWVQIAESSGALLIALGIEGERS